MYNFNMPEYAFKQVENSLLNDSDDKTNETRKLENYHRIQDVQKMSNPFVGFAALDHQQRCMYDEKLPNSSVNKRYKRSLDNDIRSTEFFNYIQHNQNQYEYKSCKCQMNGFAPKFPSNVLRKMSIQEPLPDLNWDLSSGNITNVLTNRVSASDLSQATSNRNVYNINGAPFNKTKTANSFGSSFFVHPQTSLNVSSTSKSIYTHDTNNFHNPSKFVKSQSVPFSTKPNDIDVQNNHQACIDNNTISNSVNYFCNESVQPGVINNLCYRNNNSGLINNVQERKESIQEFCESDIRGTILDNHVDHPVMKSSSDMYTVNVSSFQNRDDQPSDVVTNVRNSIPYIKHTLPVFVYNNHIAPDTKTMNNCPQFCFPFHNDSIITNNFNSADQVDNRVQNIDTSEKHLLLQQVSSNDTNYCYVHAINGIQQLPPCNDIKNLSTPLMEPDNNNHDHDQVIIPADLVSNEDNQATAGSPNLEIQTKTVHKFTITTSKEADIPISINKVLSKEVSNESDKSDNQQPLSRFKKTRIRETVERWFYDRYGVYDYRFKVIPTKIMELQDKNFEQMFKQYDEILNQHCEDRDNGYRCHSTKYNSKEFQFWETGERISIRGGQPDCDTANCCQFHAKFINVLNQNQNLSLSQFAAQHFNVASGTQSYCPHIVHEAYIPSPETNYHPINVDINCTENAPFSAPPASPSLQNYNPSRLHSHYGSQSITDLVMLNSHTPLIQTSVSIHTSLMNESIERLFHNSSSRMSLASDHRSMSSHTIDVLDNHSLVDLFQKSPRNHDNIALLKTSPSYTKLSNVVDDCPTPVMGSNGRVMEQCTADRTLSSNFMHEIDDTLMNLKSLVRNLVITEQQPLINEIRSLVIANNILKSDLCTAKKRSKYLESVLKEHSIAIDNCIGHEITSMPNLSAQSHDTPCDGGHRTWSPLLGDTGHR